MLSRRILPFSIPFSIPFSTHGRWPSAPATVTSCEWVSLEDAYGCGGNAGHYHVEFTYRAKAEGPLEHGSFCHPGNRYIAPFAVGETLMVRYNPRRPSQSRFSGASLPTQAIEAIVAVAVLGLIAGYFLLSY